MADPFPPAPAWLMQLSQPLADFLGLQTLPLHLHEIVFFALLYQLIYSHFSPWISNLLVGERYCRLPGRTRLNWNVHVVSFVQSSMIIALALHTIFSDGTRWSHSWRSTRSKEPGAPQLIHAQQRVWAYTPLEGHVVAMAVGYFLWDLIVCARYLRIFGVGLLLHAIAALTVYAIGFTPFVNYYSPVFILYECSSPALNIHWFLDKLDMTGSKLQWYNGVVLLSSFAGSRLIWGTYAGFRVFWDIWQGIQYPVDLSKHHSLWATERLLSNTTKSLEFVPMAYDDPMRFAKNGITVTPWMGGIYLTSMLTLSFLNFYWFGKMIKTVRSRFAERAPPKGPGYERQSSGARLPSIENLRRRNVAGAS